ncbi:MAG: hypothetical protein ACTSRC_00095 [Candidatus Helarchaeota archaeon]
MEPRDIIQKLETLYQSLMTKDLTPDEEAQSKVQLLEILSSIKAHSDVHGGDQAGNIQGQVENLKDMLLDWDPYGSAWFKEEKTLVDAVYNLLAAVKTLSLQNVTTSGSVSINTLSQKIEGIENTLRSELDNLKTEVATIKKSVISLATAMKEKFASMNTVQSQNRIAPSADNQKPMPTSAPVLKQVSMPVSRGAPLPKPVPIPTQNKRETTPKPISLPRPIPIPLDVAQEDSAMQPVRRAEQATIAIPKSEPEPIPLDGPVPIPLDGSDFIEPEPLSNSNEEIEPSRDIFKTLSSSKNNQTKATDKENLFSLFVSSPKEVSGESQLEIIEDPAAIANVPPIQATSSVYPSGSAGGDAESLYQELISLEGKRYSIERGIRDLKTDRENGVISDHEYKDKLSQELNKLQSISKRIGEIREKLD